MIVNNFTNINKTNLSSSVIMTTTYDTGNPGSGTGTLIVAGFQILAWDRHINCDTGNPGSGTGTLIVTQEIQVLGQAH